MDCQDRHDWDTVVTDLLICSWLPYSEVSIASFVNILWPCILVCLTVFSNGQNRAWSLLQYEASAKLQTHLDSAAVAIEFRRQTDSFLMCIKLTRVVREQELNLP